MKFGKYNKDEFIPGKKPCLKEKDEYPYDEIIQHPEKEKQETLKAIQKIGKVLTAEQLLEVK